MRNNPLNNFKKTIWLVIFLTILLMGTTIRFYEIGNPSRGFYLDEAAIGYNAYSISMTGKDEFGKSFPLLFRSFTDFKAPGYIYLSAIPIKILGLNPFSTRFISALAGSLSLLVVFFFIKLLVDQNLKFKNQPGGYILPVLVTLIIAISPWHVFYSRGAWEANLSFLILLTASYLCVIGFMRKKGIIFLLGSILFVLSAYAYHGQRIVAPLILGSYLIYLRHWLLANKKFFILAFFIILVFAFPIFKISLTPGGQSRMKALNIFSEQSALPWLSEKPTDTPIDSRLLISTRKWFALYTAYYSPKNLFSPDPAEKQRWLVDLAAFYPWQFIFFAIGIIYFIHKKEYSTLRVFVLPWFLFSPVAASFTGDPFSSVRALPMVLPISVIIAVGIWEFIAFLKRNPVLRFAQNYINVITFLAFSLIILISLINLLTQILYILPHQRGKYWEIGYAQLADELLKHPTKKIIIDNTRGESYIHILFFTKFDPKLYQQEAGYLELPEYYSSYNRVSTKKFGRFEYRPIDWGKDIREGNLIVGDELLASRESILNNPYLELVKEIKYPDESIAFRIIKVKSISYLSPPRPGKTSSKSTF